MPLLKIFLESQFEEELRTEIAGLIEELALRPFFNNTIGLLENPEIIKDEITIATISSGLLRNINYKLGRFPTVEDKISRQRLFGILFERLLTSFISKNLKNTEDILRALDESLYITCIQQGYDHRLMKKLFDFEVLKNVISNLQIKNPDLPNGEKGAKVQKYVWLQKGRLSILVDLLQKNNYIKSKKEFFDLFFKTDETMPVRWNKEKKQHLAYLLSKLFSEGYARIEGNKGYFSYAEKNFITFEKTLFLPNSLKKLSSVMSKKPSSYIAVTDEINDLLRQINK